MYFFNFKNFKDCFFVVAVEYKGENFRNKNNQ